MAQEAQRLWKEKEVARREHRARGEVSPRSTVSAIGRRVAVSLAPRGGPHLPFRPLSTRCRADRTAAPHPSPIARLSSVENLVGFRTIASPAQGLQVFHR